MFMMKKGCDKKVSLCFLHLEDGFISFIHLYSDCLLPSHCTCKELTCSLSNNKKKSQKYGTCQRTDKIDYTVLVTYT